MTTTCARFFTGLALSAAVIFSAPPASGQPVQSETAPNGFPAARCSRPADQEALRITQLVEFVEKSRRMAVRSRARGEPPMPPVRCSPVSLAAAAASSQFNRQRWA